ncbi:hypothetical protein PIB30_047460 [Stylosanthes scabra]|uniref:Uncharacterized protein n=1 Tax=Stylosanthes scabra TaxID=79078 RepID=A0ABU6YE27_9FABA|nr:hypothetical protein [Stylosanthes scabra]
MDCKRNQAALKGKEKVRVPPTQVLPRLATLRTPQSPPLKTRTPPSRALPRLATLKDPLLSLSPTSVLKPKKLLVLALAASMKNGERKLEEQETKIWKHSGQSLHA